MLGAGLVGASLGLGYSGGGDYVLVGVTMFWWGWGCSGGCGDSFVVVGLL